MDELVDAMQTPESKLGAQKLFSASSQELGHAAVAGARRDKKRGG
jgi:hypothetical protein